MYATYTPEELKDAKEKVGQRAFRNISDQRGANITVCCAVSACGGLRHYQILQGGMKKHLLQIFLQVLCGNIILDEGEDATEFRIFDNAPGRRGLEDMNCNGIFKIKRLPKYSLFLPMVENTSSCWTSALKRNLAERMDAFQKPTEFDVAGRSLQEYGFDTLRGIIEAAACQITETKCIGWYNHTMSYIP